MSERQKCRDIHTETGTETQKEDTILSGAVKQKKYFSFEPTEAPVFFNVSELFSHFFALALINLSNVAYIW